MNEDRAEQLRESLKSEIESAEEAIDDILDGDDQNEMDYITLFEAKANTLINELSLHASHIDGVQLPAQYLAARIVREKLDIFIEESASMAPDEMLGQLNRYAKKVVGDGTEHYTEKHMPDDLREELNDD